MALSPRSTTATFVGGFVLNRTLYVCRARYGDSIHVGKAVDKLALVGEKNHATYLLVKKLKNGCFADFRIYLVRLKPTF